MRQKLLSVLCLCMVVVMTATTCLATEAPSLKDDFYAAVNAEWLATAEIPADRPSAGGFDELSDDVEAILMADFAAILDGEKEADTPELASFVDYYRLAMDFEARNAAGAEPLAPYMAQVEALTSVDELSALVAEWSVQGMPLPFALSVMADMKNASMNALYVSEPSLFLLDKSYYADEAMRGMLQGLFAQTSTNLMLLAGKTEAEAAQIVEQALAFDESLVPYIPSAEEASDYTKLYNPMDLAAFDGQITGFDFAGALNTLLGEVPETIITTNPEYFAALDTLVNEDTFENLRSWLLLQTVRAMASYLDEDFRIEAGSFSRMVYGIAEATSPERTAFYLATGMFDEVVGVYYGKTYFGEQARQDVAEMVAAIIETYESRLAANTWLSESTRETAISKLNAMAINVGYPDAPRSLYAQMVTVPASEGGTLLGNAMEFTRLSMLDNYSKWNTPVDRGLWPLSASTVNAMYNPLENSINFPAAILQAPFYSVEQSASANYGGIGAVIAHEISHAFDPSGSKFDENGSLADWWTEEDYATFAALSQAMVDEFDGLEYAGGTVNGTLTVSENVADAGGLACALEAAKAEEDVDLQALFTNWAVIWRQIASPEYEALLLTLDVHAPSKLRANIQLQNMDDFFDTFGIEEGDGMYRAPEDRVIIW